MSTRRLGITAGDPGGVGAEVLLRALRALDDKRQGWPTLVIFGDQQHIDHIAQRFSLPPLSIYEHVELVDCPVERDGPFVMGELSAAGAVAQVRYIEQALAAVDEGDIVGFVTCPIHKQALAQCGLPYHGHTEWLEDHAKTDVAMMLAGPILRTVPVTVHIPLSEVPQKLTTESIFTHIKITAEGLTRWFGIETPRIGVCGLNPHAGDDGLLGHEDKEVVAPAIAQARALGIDVWGPFPGDTVFYFAYQERQYDAVVAMYHDQALAPLKLVHFEDAVNLTLGLPFLRTSVDHGTAYDIAALGQANPTSMIEALGLAASLLIEKPNA